MPSSRAKSKKKSSYVREDNPKLEKVARALRRYVHELFPEARLTVNAWGIPTFELPDPFCFYMVGKNHVTFGFHYGSWLEDPEELLEGTGKNLRHVKLRQIEDLAQKGLKDLVLTAARLGGRAPMKSMSGSRRPSKTAPKM
jgi:hypothetical protein